MPEGVDADLIEFDDFIDKNTVTGLREQGLRACRRQTPILAGGYEECFLEDLLDLLKLELNSASCPSCALLKFFTDLGRRILRCEIIAELLRVCFLETL